MEGFWKACNATSIKDDCKSIVRTEEEDRKRSERRWDKWSVVMDTWKVNSVCHARF